MLKDLQGLEKAGLDESQQVTPEGNKPNQQDETVL